MVDVRDDVLPVESLLLRVSQLLPFAIQMLEFRGQFLPAQVQFTEREDFRLIGIQQPLTLPFEALASLQHLGLLGSEGSEIGLFGLRPALVEVWQERWGLE